MTELAYLVGSAPGAGRYSEDNGIAAELGDPVRLGRLITPGRCNELGCVLELADCSSVPVLVALGSACP